MVLKPLLDNHILRITCSDEKGLVYKITEVLYQKGLNIVQNGEFVDHEIGCFFMRTEFSGDADSKDILKKLKPRLPKDAAVELTKNRKKNIVIFATKEHHCLGDLLIRHAYGELHANISAVVSNHDFLKKLVASFKIPFHFISNENQSRESHESKILKVLKPYSPEYLVLAKYMRIFSPEFVSRFKNSIINIHHSFLPAFVGANPY